MSDRTVVLLHGFGGAPAAFERVIEAWPGERPTFVAPPLPGHHKQHPAQPDGGFADAVDALAAHLPSGGDLGLVGYSLGARLTLGLATAFPRRFERITLVGVNPGLDDQDRPARRDHDERWATLIEREGLERFFEAWQAQPLFSTQHRLPPAVRLEQSRWRTELEGEPLAAAMRQMSLADMPDYRPALAELELPVQLVVGELDTKFHRLANLMQSELRSYRLDIVDGVGHNVPLEAPEALAELLAAFHRPR